MSRPLRIAHVAPVAMALPPAGSGSVELMTWLLTEGLARAATYAVRDRGSTTSARLRIYDRGYVENPDV
jgi:hypothetical protein